MDQLRSKWIVFELNAFFYGEDQVSRSVWERLRLMKAAGAVLIVVSVEPGAPKLFSRSALTKYVHRLCQGEEQQPRGALVRKAVGAGVVPEELVYVDDSRENLEAVSAEFPGCLAQPVSHPSHLAKILDRLIQKNGWER